MKILVIDDDPFSEDLLPTILSDVAHVEVVRGCQSGLETASRNPPHLILYNALMGNFRGAEMCRQLRSKPETADTLVVCISGWVDEREEMEALAAGAIDYIKKPINIPLFRARIKAHLDLAKRFAQVRERARRDPLTYVFNRGYFDERLSAEWSRHRRAGDWLCVALVDLDHFKAFNDLYGHMKGDECLRAVADRLMQCVQRGDDVLARYGGEEFVFLLPSAAPRGAANFGAKVRDEIARLSVTHEATKKGILSASVGVATMIPNDTSAAVDLLRNADEALYIAKREGRDRYIVHGA